MFLFPATAFASPFIINVEPVVQDEDPVIIAPSFDVERVGEITKPVWYGDSVQLQVVVHTENDVQMTYLWTRFDREENWWKPIETAPDSDTFTIENVIGDCEIMCVVTDDTGYGKTVQYSIRVSKNSEKCGDNLDWSLENGVLTISGAGEMYNYFAQKGFGPPWYDRIGEVQTVIVGSGVESVGGYAFTDAVALTSVTIPDSTWLIGDHAFQNSGLIDVYLPDADYLNVQGYAFESCQNLQTVSIGKYPEKILEYAFANCPKLHTITYRGLFHNISMEEEFHGITATIEYPCNLSQLYQDYFQCSEEDGNRIVLNQIQDMQEYSTDADLNFCKYHTYENGVCTECGAYVEHTLMIPEGVETISSEAFSETNAEVIVVPESVGVIEAKAFANSKNLRTLVLEGSPYSIVLDILEGCDNVIVSCRKNSSAENWAKNRGLTVIYR